ncbi:MAG: EAL domain-containing protein [Betaproteobacteria bacterium]|nr:EAL domain-containing protein [Betaproteobacteria bacterium]
MTRRKEAESELRLAAVAFQTQEGIIVTDARSVILRVNDAFTRMTGYEAEECVGKTPSLFRSEKQDSAFFKEMWHSILTTGSWEGELWNRRKSGDLYLQRLVITAVKDSQGNIVNYVGTSSDITMNRAAAEEIRDLAFYDTLTRLPNRRLFLDRLHQAMTASARSGRKGALLLLDLDNFKMINDTLGHDMGDSLLQQVAHRITSSLRQGDTVARLGGDEFVVLVVDVGEDSLEVAEKAKDIGSKLLAQLNRPFLLGDSPSHNTPSIGLTIFSGRETPEEIMKQADIAMYHSKRAGRNTLRFFDQQMQEAINAHASLERDLRIALDRGQFELYYQVQVDGWRHPVGAEALIRWNHPLKGIILPNEFIPVAEESDLIIGIGDWVLESACAQLAEWSKNPHTSALILSVNISSRQLRHPHFVEKLRDTIARHQVQGGHLKLEITESMLLEESESTIRLMDRLNTLGLHLTLDDFGTGYSSLSYLKRLPIDQIKIDRSFVQDMVTDPHDIALIHTIIAMAHNLHISTIAEGVETDEQLKLLTDSGCDTYQGYLFGKPLPSRQFKNMVQAR